MSNHKVKDYVSDPNDSDSTEVMSESMIEGILRKQQEGRQKVKSPVLLEKTTSAFDLSIDSDVLAWIEDESAVYAIQNDYKVAQRLQGERDQDDEQDAFWKKFKYRDKAKDVKALSDDAFNKIATQYAELDVQRSCEINSKLVIKHIKISHNGIEERMFLFLDDYEKIVENRKSKRVPPGERTIDQQAYRPGMDRSRFERQSKAVARERIRNLYKRNWV